MNKTPSKEKPKILRKLEKERQQRRIRTLTWSTLAVIAVIVVLAIAFRPSSTAQFDYGKLPVLGNANAPVKIIEFGDYKCPSCQYFAQQIEPRLKKDFIDTGAASMHFMNFTIIGPDSNTAALAGQSIYHQSNDAYWAFYEAVYRNQGNEKVEWATPDFLTSLAQKENIKVDYAKLQQDIVSRTYQNEVDEHNAIAKKKNNLSGTPTLFINGKKKFDDIFNYDA